MKRRIAAFEALAEHVDADLDYCCAELALAAADEVMFSGPELERAAKDSWNALVTRDGGRPWDELIEPLQRAWIANVRIIASALKGAQP